MFPLYLVRHGQSEANVQQVVSCDPNVATEIHGLTEKGRVQAREAGQRIKERIKENLWEKIQIISSDFKRARETAEIIAKVLHTSVSFDILLRERNFGDLNGKEDSWYDSVYKEDEEGITSWNVESVESVAGRVTQFLAKLHDHNIFVVVSHGDVLQIAQTILDQGDLKRHFERGLKNCEVKICNWKK